MAEKHEVVKHFSKDRAVIKVIYPDNSTEYCCATFRHQSTADGECRYWDHGLPPNAAEYAEEYPKAMRELATKLNADNK